VRPWYEGPLRVLGLAWIVVGGTLFVLSTSLGAPRVPLLDLPAVLAGLWFAVLRPWLRVRRERTRSSRGGT
jgi:hypothetical protein